jgi:Holliday junction resolvase RusA-like endonuclease
VVVPGVDLITFTVPGPPHGKGRARSTRGGRHYTPAKTVRYEAIVAQCARKVKPREPFGGPVGVRITAFRARPDAPRPGHECRRTDAMLYGRVACTMAPDVDNIAKTVLDGCNHAGVWGDDRQVAELVARKVWCEVGEEARVEVSVYSLEEL